MIYGLILLAVAVGMVLVVRPWSDKSPAFLRSWALGQVYVLSCLVCTVVGASLIVRSLPSMD